jgi:AAA+ superfamily predicted ATPase
MTATDGLFSRIDQFPSGPAAERYAALVGLDDVKRQLEAQARVLLAPDLVAKWSEHHHRTVLPAVDDVARRTPLIVLAGDVGTGKTEVAETVGDAVARSMGIEMLLYPLSLSARGRGAVGEMTTLLTAAFAAVREVAAGGRSRDGKTRHGVILMIDEADAIAQSRELAQMHHEDRAGVNALIRGIDELRADGLPVLTIMCTNRLEAVDPAVLRRAAGVFEFSRPNDQQRARVILEAFDGLGLTQPQLDALVEATGPIGGRDYGCTYSDLRQRFIPGAVLDAFPDRALTVDRLLELAREFVPTRPFGATT